MRIINYHHKDIPDGFPRKPNPERWDKFKTFINELIDNYNVTYKSEEDLEKLDIDYWICGSDQIWNTDLTNGFNKGFFLDFDTNGKKIVYAVSMGREKLDEQFENEFKECINKLDAISVREESLKEYTRKFTNKMITRVLDPTLLLEKNDYEDVIQENKYGEYILIYALEPDERLSEVAKIIANKEKLKILELNDKKNEKYFCEQVSNAGPKDFLTLYKNAKAIITNSFHGTVFSIIFQKEFYTITCLNRNSRIENILDIVEMRDRFINDVKDIEKVKEQDYNKAYKNLKIERKKSQDFLKKALEMIEDEGEDN